MASTITADSGAVSGSAGLKQSADSSGVLALATGTGTTAVTIDASQNVGIGTSSPGGKLGISGAGPVTFRINDTNTNNWDITNNSYLSFTRGSTEAMRIDSSGNLLVGYTSGGSTGTVGIVKAVGYNTKAGTGASLNTNNFNINFGTGAQLWIDTTNLGTFSLTSDYRIKKDIQTQTLSALDRVAQLRPVTYEFGDYKDLFKADGVAREGFIAHELQAVIPSAVDGEKDSENQIQSLRLDALCSVLTKAIQEQQALITTLTERITALEAK
jgi:hypothetical protein